MKTMTKKTTRKRRTGAPQCPDTPPSPSTTVYHDCDFHVEDPAVLCVERRLDGQGTIIGYRNEMGNMLEWHLPITPEAHATLLRRFRAKIGLLITDVSSTKPTFPTNLITESA